MPDFEHLSDEALRLKLIENGFPIMPITATTRKIVIKKLKLLQENKKRQNAIDRRATMAKYSSDDDSEVDKKSKARRATVATTNGNHRKSQRSATFKSPAPATAKNTQESTQNARRTRRTAETQTHLQMAADTNSDSEPEIDLRAKKRQPPQKNEESDEENSLGITIHPNESFLSPINTLDESTSFESPPKLFTTAPRRHTPSVQRPRALKSPYSAFESTLTTGSLTSTPGEDQSRGYFSRDEQEAEFEAPYLQNFSKRLSLLTQQKPPEDRTERRYKRVERAEYIKASSEGFFVKVKQKVMKYFRKSDVKRSISSINNRAAAHSVKNGDNKGNFISLALVAAVGVFFVVLVALYYGLHRGSNTNDIIGLQVPYCTATLTKNCLTEEDASSGVELYKIFKPKLIELAIDYQCGDFTSSSSPSSTTQAKKRKFYMTDQDIVRFIMKNYKLQNERAILQDIDSLVLIAHHNQFLGISVLKVDLNNDGDEYQVVEDVKNANKDLETGQYTRAFAVLSPTLPWKCSFWQKVSALLNAVVVILIVAAILHACKYGFQRYNLYQHKKKEEVMMLVEKILEIMQTQSGDDQYLVINHVRDMIIPIDSRKKMETQWRKALTFIDENESRIRTEIQTVKGESYQVWRWIGGQNISMNCSTASANKSWQGQAFEAQEPPCSPTPCLKIRGMIDDGDRNCNKATIREAILSKCANCRVLHISIDINTKCVYLKCADSADAGIAYRSLHGNWFAGHLVTVKYLRLERYMQRFPDSPVSGPPFLKAQ